MAENLRIDFFSQYLIEISKSSRDVSLLIKTRNATGESRRIPIEPQFEVELGSAGRWARFRLSSVQADGNLKFNIDQDRWSSTPVFVFQNHDSVFVSNRDFLIFEALAARAFEFEFNPNAIFFFLKNGYVPLGESFVAGLELIIGNAVISLGPNEKFALLERSGIGFPDAPPSKVERSPGDWLAVLKSALDSDIRDFDLNVFRMSGGVDTRTLSFLLGEEEKKNIKFEITAHPGLAQELDADVFAAQKQCLALQVPLKIHSDQDIGYSFFHARNRERILSGLYGGEFLGGTALLEWPQKFDFDLELTDGGHHHFHEYETRLLAKELVTAHVLTVFRKTYHSYIYGKVSTSWRAPWMNSVFAVSPFTHPGFLDLVNETGLEEMQNYRVYRAVFSHLLDRVTESLRSVPLSSQITNYDAAIPDVMRDVAGIKNPKDILRESVKLEPARRQRFIKGLRKVGIQTETINWENKDLFDRLISIGQWMKFNSQTLFRDIV